MSVGRCTSVIPIVIFSDYFFLTSCCNSKFFNKFLHSVCKKCINSLLSVLSRPDFCFKRKNALNYINDKYL